ncbi:MAG: GAF domain-containing protein, partial [Anaerolineae bacterium]
MNLWERIRPLIYPQVESREGLEDIRQYILQAILRVASLLGLLALLINAPNLITNRLWIYLGLYAFLEAWLLFVTYSGRIPYTLRVGSILGILYLIGVGSTLQFATAGDGRIWLLGMVLLGTIFLGLGAGVAITLISGLTYLFIGGMMSTQIIPAPVFTGGVGLPTHFSTWTTTGMTYFTIGIVLVMSVAALVHNINTTLTRATHLAHRLETESQETQKRARQLERRQQQLYTAAEIAGILGRVHNVDELLQTVVNLLQERFSLYYCGIFLLDEQGTYAVLHAGTGEAGREMRARGHRLAVGGSSMIGWCIANRKARIALDTGQEAVRFANPLLPLTRSELALPILLGERILGALTIQSQEPNAFDEDDITVLQGIATSLATAIENAQLVQRLQRTLEQVQRLNQQFLVDAWQRESALRQDTRKYELENPRAPVNLPETRTLKVPLTLRGITIGEITLEGAQPWGEGERRFVESMATQAAQALENARLVRETLQQAQREQVVSTITEQIRANLDMEDVLRASVDALQQTLK